LLSFLAIDSAKDFKELLPFPWSKLMEKKKLRRSLFIFIYCVESLIMVKSLWNQHFLFIFLFAWDKSIRAGVKWWGRWIHKHRWK
jgi:hypothetical protein